jgi:hypothetical protein
MKVEFITPQDDLRKIDPGDGVVTLLKVEHSPKIITLEEGLTYEKGVKPTLQYFFLARYKDKAIVSAVRPLTDTDIMECQRRLFQKELPDYKQKIDESVVTPPVG